MTDNKKRNWHNLTNLELEQAFKTDTATGLSDREADKRLRRGRNRVWIVESTSIRKYTARSFTELTTIMLIVAVIVSAFFGGAGTAVAVCMMLFLARALRIASYVFARRVLEKNAKSAIPRAKVVRNGNVKEISADKIVVGDVVILDAGDTVPCDIRLTAADGVRVVENHLTDVSGISEKSSNPLSGDNIPISLRSNMVYATSTIVGGFGIGLAVATGGETLAVSRTGPIELSDENNIPLFEKINDISRYTELGLIAFVLLISLIGVLIGGKDIVTVFMPAVSMAAACLGEFITAILFVSYAVGFGDKNRENSILRSTSAAEKIAETDTIFFRSSDILKSGKISLHSYYTHESFNLLGTKGTKIPLGLLSLACYTTGVSPSGSIATGAYGQHIRQTSVLPYRIIQSLTDEYPDIKKNYSSYSVVAHLTSGEENSDGFDCSLVAKENSFYFVVAGRLEQVLSRCIGQSTNHGIVSIDDSDKKKILSYADTIRKRGVSILAIAKRESPYNNLSRVSVLETNLIFEGFIAVADRIDKETKKFLAGFRRDGGHLIVFSEENETNDTDRYFLESEGVFKTGDLATDGKDTIPFDQYPVSIVATSSGMDGVRERIKHINYAKSNRLTSMYVGTNVEDVWCMQVSDVSVASGDRIPQSLRHTASGMIQSGHGLSNVVSSSKSVMLNIKNVLMYLVYSQVSRIVLMLISALGAFPVPDPQHMVYWGLLLDISVSIAIVFSKRKDYISFRNKPYPNTLNDILYPMLYGTLASSCAVAAPYLGRAIMLAATHQFTLVSGQIMECIFIGVILSMIPVALDYSSTDGLFSGKSKYTKMFILPIVIVVLGIVLSIISSGAFPGWIMLSFSLIPCLIVVIVMAIVRVLTNKTKNNKTDETVKI